MSERVLDPAALLPPPPASVHFMGLGGIGVSGLAAVLLARGYRVGGCDLTMGALTESLRANGAVVYEGHDPAHLAGVDLLVVTSAVAASNPELAAARAAGLPVLKRAALLGALLRPLDTIVVAGSHGKTTTSALIASILFEAGLDPTAFVGGEVPALGSNARVGRGEWAVAEGDEYDYSFLQLRPRVAVVTNVEHDHSDIYEDLAAVEEAFRRFIALLPPDGALVVCRDDAAALRLSASASCRVLTYGLDGPADWTASDITLDEYGAHFTLHRRDDGATLPVRTTLSGRHNVANAVAAVAAVAEAGVSPATAARILERTQGPRRRQEVKGHAAGGALIVDDYAHHPTEIAATLAGLRARYPSQRLRVAYQPHTYSRTRLLLAETGASLRLADDVAVTEIYAARETNTFGVSGQDVVAATNVAGGHATLTPHVSDAAAWLALDAGADVVLVTMGAGDIWRAGETVRV